MSDENDLIAMSDGEQSEEKAGEIILEEDLGSEADDHPPPPAEEKNLKTVCVETYCVMYEVKQTVSPGRPASEDEESKGGEKAEATSADLEEEVAPEVEEEPQEELPEEQPEEPQVEYKEEPAKIAEEEDDVEEFKPQKIVYDSDEEEGGQKRVLDLADSDDDRSSENRENMMSRIEKYQKAAVDEEKGQDRPKISEAEMPTRGRVSSLMSMFENKAVENALEAQKMSSYKKAYGVSNRPGQVNKGIFK